MEGFWRNSASLGSVLRRPAMVVRSFSTASSALFLLAAEKDLTTIAGLLKTDP